MTYTFEDLIQQVKQEFQKLPWNGRTFTEDETNTIITYCWDEVYLSPYRPNEFSNDPTEWDGGEELETDMMHIMEPAERLIHLDEDYHTSKEYIEKTNEVYHLLEVALTNAIVKLANMIKDED